MSRVANQKVNRPAVSNAGSQNLASAPGKVFFSSEFISKPSRRCDIEHFRGRLIAETRSQILREKGITLRPCQGLAHVLFVFARGARECDEGSRELHLRVIVYAQA